MHLRYESPRILGRILADAGFQNLARHWLPIVPSRLQRLQPVVESRFVRLALSTITPVGALLSHAFVYRATRAYR